MGYPSAAGFNNYVEISQTVWRAERAAVLAIIALPNLIAPLDPLALGSPQHARTAFTTAPVRHRRGRAGPLVALRMGPPLLARGERSHHRQRRRAGHDHRRFGRPVQRADRQRPDVDHRRLLDLPVLDPGYRNCQRSRSRPDDGDRGSHRRVVARRRAHGSRPGDCA